MKTMRKITQTALVAAACLLLAGCLVGETTHTLYLDPDGALRWSVLERNIRSDEQEPAERRREEHDYIGAAFDGDHPVARALALLAPTRLRTQVVRSRRPFTVLTEADYPSLADLARTLIEGLDGRGDAWMEADGGSLRFVMVLDATHEPEEEHGLEELGALLADPEDYQIHLTAGRFVESVGFRIEGEGNIAVPEEVEEGDAGQVVYSLTWTGP